MVWYPKIYTIKKKGSTGTEFPFPSGRCSIGGDSTCDIQIRGAGLAHCLLVVDKNKQAHVINVAGTKDVLRNDEHVPNEAFLSHGDIVTIGSRQFRFEWALTQKKGETLTPTPSNGTQQSKGGTRESSTSKDDTEKESVTAQQTPGTPGISTPTTSFFDQSFHKTPCIPPEDFVSPLSTSNLSDVGHQSERPSRSRSAVAYGAARNGQGVMRAKRLSWSDGVPYSPSDVSDVSSPRKLLRAKQSSISTNFAIPIQEVGSPKGCNGSGIVPVAESPVGEQLYNSSDSTPLIDEPRMRAMRSRGSLASMSDASTEDERSVSLRRLSKGPVKRRRSSEIVTEGQSPKLKRKNDHEDIQDTSLASHSGCDEQLVAEKSLIKNSVEECTIHIKGLATSGTPNGILISSTPVAGVNTRASRMETGSARKSKTLLRQAQKNRSVYSTPQLSNSYLASNAASPELSFLTTRSGSRMALRSFKGNESADGLQTSSVSDGTLGCELLFETPGSSFNLSSTNTRENGMVHDMSISSAHCEPTQQTSAGASTTTQTSDSGRRRSAALPKMSEQNEVQQLETAGMSPRCADSRSMTGLKSSRTPASKKVDDEVPCCGLSGTPNASSASKTKRTSISKRSDQETTKQEDVDSAQSLKASGTKRTPSSRKTKKEEAPELESVSTSFPAQANADNMDVSQENSFSSGGASTSVNVTAGDPELVAIPTSLNTSRAKRTSTLRKLNKETTKQEQSGTPKSVKILGADEGTPTASHVDEKLQQSSACVSSFKDESANGVDIAMGESVISARSPRSGRVSASRTPASRKPSEKISERESVSTPVNKLTEVTDKIYGVDLQLVVGNENNGQTPLENRETVSEESFRLRSGRSSRTPASNVGHFDTPGLVAAGSPNSSTASKVKQTPGLKKTDRRDSSRNNGVDTSLALSTSGHKETVASPMVEDFEQQAACASPLNHFTLERVDVAIGKSVRRRRSSHMPDALNISSAKSTPVSTNANDSTREEVVNTAHSKRISVCKQTPASKKASEKTVEQVLETSSNLDCTADNSKESSRKKSERSSCTPSSKAVNSETQEQVVCTPGAFSSLKASTTTPVLKGMEKTNEDAPCMPQSARISGGKRTSALKKVQQNDEAADPKSLDAFPLKHVSSDSLHDTPGESARTKCGRMSHVPAVKSLNADVLEQDRDRTSNTLNTSRATRMRASLSEETTKQDVAGAAKYLRASGAKHTPASKKMTQEMEPSDKESVNTIPSKHESTGDTEVAMAESIKKRHLRTSRTPASMKVSAGAPQEEALEALNMLNVSATPTNIEEEATGQRTRSRVSSALATSDSAFVAVEESMRKRSSRLSHTEKLSTQMLEQNIVVIPSTDSASTAVQMPISINEEATEQNTRETPKTARAAKVKQTPGSAKANKGTPQRDMGGTSPSKDAVPDSVTAAMEGSARARRGRCKSTPVSKGAYADVLEQEAPGIPDVLDTSAVKHTPASQKTNKETAKQQVAGTPRPSRISETQEQAQNSKHAIQEQEDSKQETICLSPFKQVASDSRDVTMEESIRTRNGKPSRTPVSRKHQLDVSQKDKVAGTPKSPKVSGSKQKHASGKVREEEDDTQHEVAELQSVGGTSNGTDVAAVGFVVKESARASGTSEKVQLDALDLEAPNTQSSSRPKRTVVSKKVNNKVMESDNTGTPKLKAVKSRRTPASGNLNDQDKVLEQELKGMPPSEHATPDVADSTVEQTTIRSARSRRTPASRCLDADVPKLEAVGTPSSSKAKQTPISETTSEHLEHDTTDTLSCSKAAGAEESLASGKMEEKEETSSEMDTVNVVLEDSTVPVRSTRLRRAVASRKVNVEVFEQDSAGQPHSKKASRVKHTLAPKKVHEDDGHGSSVEPFKENMVSLEKEPVQSPVQVRRKRTAALRQQKKDENCDPTDTSSSQQKPEQELEDEAVAHPPTTTTRRGRGKRALASQEEPVGTQLSTVEDNVGAIKKKRGRQPKEVVVDVLEQNGAEELSTKVSISSKSTKSRRAGSSKQEQNDAAPASDPSHGDEAVLPASLRRSKRKAVEVTAPVTDHATVEVTPKKTRGRRAKAVESTNTDEQGSAVKALKNGQPDEVPPARRTRKRV